MSIVRIGLAETKNFADGYDAIFNKKKKITKAPPAEDKPAAMAEDKPAAKKKAKKKK